MRRGLAIATGVTAAAGAGVAVTAWRRAARTGSTPDRWHSVTINCSPERLGPMPAPLDELGFPVEVLIRPAPGDRGTELAARAVEPGADRDTVRHLRRALRSARSLAEVGEVLLPDAPGTSHRTLTGAPLAYATRHGREEGRL
ncbi:hypothetical protein ACQP1P_11350 [Dactylosporangium sp. CA-052675]|uniref:hypothetical protein n=1 Tax=Dactylosporangium sp. CA-052675 TaxID=3239927 RepID=UPI003D8CEC79